MWWSLILRGNRKTPTKIVRNGVPVTRCYAVKTQQHTQYSQSRLYTKAGNLVVLEIFHQAAHDKCARWWMLPIKMLIDIYISDTINNYQHSSYHRLSKSRTRCYVADGQFHPPVSFAILVRILTLMKHKTTMMLYSPNKVSKCTLLTDIASLCHAIPTDPPRNWIGQRT